MCLTVKQNVLCNNSRQTICLPSQKPFGANTANDRPSLAYQRGDGIKGPKILLKGEIWRICGKKRYLRQLRLATFLYLEGIVFFTMLF